MEGGPESSLCPPPGSCEGHLIAFKCRNEDSDEGHGGRRVDMRSLLEADEQEAVRF